MNKKNILLFLTACVNPKGMTFTALQNPQIRLEQYLKAVTYYLEKTDFDILLVENSGFDFTPYFEEYIETNRIEILSFQGNDYDKKLGKGYGEGLILEYAFNHSAFINNHDYIVKVTGRHIILNINRVVGNVCLLSCFNKRMVSTVLSWRGKVAYSEIIIAFREFYPLYFLKGLNKINDSQGFFFEHLLYEAIFESRLNDYMFVHIPCVVKQSGISGSTGKQLDAPHSCLRDLSFFIKCILSICRLDLLALKISKHLN